MPPVLTTAAELRCPHGGAVALVTANETFFCDEHAALVETDVHAVIGCPFVLPGPKPSPCVRVTWGGGSADLDADGVPVLTAASVGTCHSAEGVAQGPALVVATQADVIEG